MDRITVLTFQDNGYENIRGTAHPNLAMIVGGRGVKLIR